MGPHFVGTIYSTAAVNGLTTSSQFKAKESANLLTNCHLKALSKPNRV